MISKTDLHVHAQMCLSTDELFLLAKDHYHKINWNRFGFLERYKKIFAVPIDPVSIFERAIRTNDLRELESICCYKYKGKQGNFEEFDITSFFHLCVWGFYLDQNIYEPLLRMTVDKHKQEGLTYVEYRHGFGGSGAEWKQWHGNFARFFKNASDDKFTAKYIVRLGSYSDLKELLEEQPDLQDTIVGIDFSGKEIAPEALLPFYQEIAADRNRTPDKTPDAVVHIGEHFFDKSLESAIRWCHQSALFGAKRLAHCIALGVPPSAAISRQPDAHANESAGERIAQIKYDIEHLDLLTAFGVPVDAHALHAELADLQKLDASQIVHRVYDKQRLDECGKRQDFVLSCLKHLGTVIEVCPTSNLCIGGIPSIQDHPFLKLYHSGVNLAICTDDPGIFKISLKDEVDFIMNSFHISPDELNDRLGDPYRFRLKGEAGAKERMG